MLLILRAAAALLLLAVACGPADAPPEEPVRGGGLVAQIASYEPLVGDGNRLIVGLLTEDNLFVSGGTATFRFSFLGEAGSDPEPAGEAEAVFLPIAEPGAVPPPDRPTVGAASEVGRGVYSAEPVSFDRPGFWEVEVVADVEGGERTATAAFSVLEEPQVPGVGARAPRTDSLTIEDEDAPPAAIDSRAETEGEVPDPELHRRSLAEAIGTGRPVLAVFATPVYCVSKFCGPITDMVSGLARRYEGEAEFVHVEIWRNFQEQVVNKAAAEWVLREDNVTEPWVFLIDGDGRIAARWDNVATPAEIEPRLRELTGG